MCFYSTLDTTTVPPVSAKMKSSSPFTTKIGKVAILLIIRKNTTFFSFEVYKSVQGMHCCLVWAWCRVRGHKVLFLRYTYICVYYWNNMQPYIIYMTYIYNWPQFKLERKSKTKKREFLDPRVTNITSERRKQKGLNRLFFNVLKSAWSFASF